MPAIPPIKKNDEVFILRGKDRGKTGRVLIVIPKEQKIVVDYLATNFSDKAPRANPNGRLSTTALKAGSSG